MDEILYPFPNFNGGTVEVWKWLSNFIPQFTGHEGMSYGNGCGQAGRKGWKVSHTSCASGLSPNHTKHHKTGGKTVLRKPNSHTMHSSLCNRLKLMATTGFSSVLCTSKSYIILVININTTVNKTGESYCQWFLFESYWKDASSKVF